MALQPLQLWPLEVQKRLIDKVAHARLADIADQGRFPDWLGFIGLALFQTAESEREHRTLTAAWGAQLLELLPPSARRGSPLATILSDRQKVLEWRALESVEHALLDSAFR